ncbi:hypothetical protein LTR08_003316 [Meristemomyces frigidus]|nr:hypothetical protein LTR08_003316 [Meristemomyces frigidus]
MTYYGSPNAYLTSLPSPFSPNLAHPATYQAISALTGITCGACKHSGQYGNLSSRGLGPSDFINGLSGLIAQLPAHESLPYSFSCISQQQDALNPGAFGHPCVILGLSPCGHMARCLPATSFGGRTFQQKWHGLGDPAKQAEKRNSWLPLQRQETMSHNEHGVLQHTGLPMPKATYIGLEGAYWIEWSLLNHFMLNQGSRRLHTESLNKLTQLHHHAQQQKGVLPATVYQQQHEAVYQQQQQQQQQAIHLSAAAGARPSPSSHLSGQELRSSPLFKGARDHKFEKDGVMISIYDYFAKTFNIRLQHPDLPLELRIRPLFKAARDHEFEKDGVMVSIYDYFAKVFNIRLQHPDLPLVKITQGQSSNAIAIIAPSSPPLGKTTVLPMEVLKIGQKSRTTSRRPSTSVSSIQTLPLVKMIKGEMTVLPMEVLKIGQNQRYTFKFDKRQTHPPSATSCQRSSLYLGRTSSHNA